MSKKITPSLTEAMGQLKTTAQQPPEQTVVPTAELVELKRKSERKETYSFRLSPSVVALLDEELQQMEFSPSRSEFVESLLKKRLNV